MDPLLIFLTDCALKYTDFDVLNYIKKFFNICSLTLNYFRILFYYEIRTVIIVLM